MIHSSTIANAAATSHARRVSHSSCASDRPGSAFHASHGARAAAGLRAGRGACEARDLAIGAAESSKTRTPGPVTGPGVAMTRPRGREALGGLLLRHVERQTDPA